MDATGDLLWIGMSTTVWLGNDFVKISLQQYLVRVKKVNIAVARAKSLHILVELVHFLIKPNNAGEEQRVENEGLARIGFATPA